MVPYTNMPSQKRKLVPEERSPLFRSYTNTRVNTTWRRTGKRRHHQPRTLLLPLLANKNHSLMELQCNHRQYRFQNGLETGSRARIKSTQTVQEDPCCSVANAVLTYSV